MKGKAILPQRLRGLNFDDVLAALRQEKPSETRKGYGDCESGPERPKSVRSFTGRATDAGVPKQQLANVGKRLITGIAAAQTASNRILNQCDSPDGGNSSGHQADKQQEKQKLNAHRFCRQDALQVSKGLYALVCLIFTLAVQF
jgi:hypothetical protein